jgi:hypothetical protein
VGGKSFDYLSPLAYKGYRLAFSLKDKERMQGITQVMLVDESGNVLKSVNITTGDMLDPHYFFFVDTNRFLGYADLYNFNNGSSQTLFGLGSFGLGKKRNENRSQDVYIHLIDGRAVALGGSRSIDITVSGWTPNGGTHGEYIRIKAKTVNLVNPKEKLPSDATWDHDSRPFFHDARIMMGNGIITIDGKVYK